jgi:hypothetical protein
MKNLLNRIAKLEEKQENGTITMDEQALFCKLNDLFDNYIYSKK